MKIYKNANLNKKHCGGVIAIGNFDGIHLGHQKVINEARKKARKNKLPLGIMTFEPVPVMFFNPKIKNHRINSLDQKKTQLKRFKLDFLMGTPQQSSFPKWYAAITKNEINAKAGKKNQTKITIRAKKI